MDITYENINENKLYIKQKFKNCGDIVQKTMHLGDDLELEIFIVYMDMLTNRESFEQNILSSILYKNQERCVIENLKAVNFPTADYTTSNNFNDIILAINSGDTVIFVDSLNYAIILSTKGFLNRGVPTCDTEVVVEGSKDAFSEVFRINTMLIRRRIKDENLKLIQKKVGVRTKTDVGIMYLDNVARSSIVDEVLKKIENINIDAILDCGYIEAFIEDSTNSFFPQVQITERPDKASSALLEGRVVIVVDNSPFVLIVPATLNVFFQASDDYYARYNIATFVRIIRYISAFIAVSLPGFYLATTLYHPSLISQDLILKFANTRATVPFPAIIELIIMEIAFEMLREGGIRLPSPVGSSVGIVGGLIIGQAAVEAGLVSPIVVIVVALTAVSTFLIPNNSLVSALRLSKYIITFSSAFLGLYGFCLGQMFLLIHLASLKSFNIPYLFPFVSPEINDYNDYQDSIIRVPLTKMKKRPFFSKQNTTRAT